MNARKVVSIPEQRSLDPQRLLTWDRFDLRVKLVYARHVLKHGMRADGSFSPVAFAAASYTEHIRVWNNFTEPCFRHGTADHPFGCAPKVGAVSFIEAYHALLLSMQAIGYSPSVEDQIPLCVDGRHQQQAHVMNGAHRIAAAIAFGIAAVPVNYTRQRQCQSAPWDFAFFAARGYNSMHSDWIVHESIVSDATLHVLHIWPRAVAAGPQLLARARAIAAASCATDGGVLYEKRVPMSTRALASYLQIAYGDVPWTTSATRYLPLNSTVASFVHVIILRSSVGRMAQCKTLVRDVCMPPDAGRHDTIQWKAACHATLRPSPPRRPCSTRTQSRFSTTAPPVSASASNWPLQLATTSRPSAQRRRRSAAVTMSAQ